MLWPCPGPSLLSPLSREASLCGLVFFPSCRRALCVSPAARPVLCCNRRKKIHAPCGCWPLFFFSSLVHKEASLRNPFFLLKGVHALAAIDQPRPVSGLFFPLAEWSPIAALGGVGEHQIVRRQNRAKSIGGRKESHKTSYSDSGPGASTTDSQLCSLPDQSAQSDLGLYDPARRCRNFSFLFFLFDFYKSI